MEYFNPPSEYVTILLPIVRISNSKMINRALLLFVTGVAFLLFSYSPKISNVALPIERVQEFSFTGSSVLEDKWWTAFQDENLNKLIDSAMQSNFDLAATWQQFLAAKATVSREASNKWPFYGTIFPEHTNVFKNVLKQVASFQHKK